MLVAGVGPLSGKGPRVIVFADASVLPRASEATSNCMILDNLNENALFICCGLRGLHQWKKLILKELQSVPKERSSAVVALEADQSTEEQKLAQEAAELSHTMRKLTRVLVRLPNGEQRKGRRFHTFGVLSFLLSMTGLSTFRCDRRSDVIDFLTEFERRFGKMHPSFVQEGFTEAVQRSRREFKLLFVYLHSWDDHGTEAFCKETLCSEAVSGFVNENFVAWGDSVGGNEGLKMSKCLKVNRFPFWAVIVAAAGQSISLLRQFEGPASVEEMLKELQSVLKESSSALIALEADQAKEDQNQLEQEDKASALGPEPEKGPDVTQVLVRLPNGERKGRRFHCNDTLQSIYDFIDSSGLLEVGSYTLVTFFPRVLYGQDELSSTLEELGLYPQASLFVELNR
ncbi:plant UBX domain-containing protein 10-like protein [Tanacetum coccineum]